MPATDPTTNAPDAADTPTAAEPESAVPPATNATDESPVEDTGRVPSQPDDAPDPPTATAPTSDAPAAGDTPTADEREPDGHPASHAADEPPAEDTEREKSPEDASDRTAYIDRTADASDATAAPSADRATRGPATGDGQSDRHTATDAANEPSGGDTGGGTSQPEDVPVPTAATAPTTDAPDAADPLTADEPEPDGRPVPGAADDPPAVDTGGGTSQPEDVPDPTAATAPRTDASDATAVPPGGAGDTPTADEPEPDGRPAMDAADEPDPEDTGRGTSQPAGAPEPTGPANADGEPGAPVRAMLGVALVLVAGRFVAAGDPTRPAWLLGYAAAGAGTGLVLAAAIAPGLRLWWRGMAVAGALVVQAGLVLGWSEPMDVTRAGPSAPVVLVAAGALGVALALWLAPAGPAGDRDAAWPGAAAIGAAVGYGATLAGGARLAAFDIAEHVSPGAEIDGWLTDLAPLVVVAALATPLALGAIAAAHGSPDPGRVTAALVAVAAVPLAASGGGWTALALATTALAAGAVAARWGRSEGGAGVAVAAIVLGGTALAVASGAGPTGVLAAALYGAVVGTLADVAATRGGKMRPGIEAS